MSVSGNRPFSGVINFSLCLVFVLAVSFAARAQEQMPSALSNNTAAATESSVNERVRVLENELERQNTKLDQLQKTIDQQQQAIQALLAKLSGPVTSGGDATSTGAPTNAAAVATANATVATTDGAAKTPAQQTPTVEQRLTKLEGDSVRIGPLRLSGDFRLRFDGIFRSASDPGNPPSLHSQNARARYRLRLNFDTDLYKTLSFHGQLATGPVNNPLTADQDFSAISARHPLFVNEAWIDYHPTKSIQLQGGRVQEIFADSIQTSLCRSVRLPLALIASRSK